MQYAKKLALVDPKLLEQLKVDREYEHIQRPAPAVAKTSLSLDIARILNDHTVPDDQKVKLYANTLRRYVNIRDEIPTQTAVQSTQPVAEPEDSPTSPWPSSPLSPPRLFTISSKAQSPVKRLPVRIKLIKWERIQDLRQRVRRKPIKWEPY